MALANWLDVVKLEHIPRYTNTVAHMFEGFGKTVCSPFFSWLADNHSAEKFVSSS